MTAKKDLPVWAYPVGCLAFALPWALAPFWIVRISFHMAVVLSCLAFAVALSFIAWAFYRETVAEKKATRSKELSDPDA